MAQRGRQEIEQLVKACVAIGTDVYKLPDSKDIFLDALRRIQKARFEAEILGRVELYDAIEINELIAILTEQPKAQAKPKK